jgi:hypothetical protein
MKSLLVNATRRKAQSADSTMGGAFSIVARVRRCGDRPPHSIVCVSIWQIWKDKGFLSFISGKNGMGVAT